MKEGATARNVFLGAVYFFTLPLWMVFIPLIVPMLIWRDYGGISTSLSRFPGISEGGGPVSALVIFGVILVVLGGLGAAMPNDNSIESNAQTGGMDVATDTPTSVPTKETDDGGSKNSMADSTSTPTATTTVSPTARPTTSQPPTAEPTPTSSPTAVPAEDGATYSFSGSSNDVTNSFSTEGGLVVFNLQHSGESNFIVKAVNSIGDEEYLTNEIGTYDGRVALYLPEGNWQLDVTADGGWSADVTQPRFNRNDVQSFPASANDKHDAWFGPFEFDENTKVTFEIKGDSQAAVWLANTNGERVDLLHNEIGPYEGSALITQRGFGIIIVDTSSAEWRIILEETQ